MKRHVGTAITVLIAAIVVVGLFMGERSEADRIRQLGTQVRCPVCQGVSVADSPSETARAMMAVITDQVQAGWSDEEVLTYFEDRYGETIILDPPLEARTILLWALPVGVLIGGAWLVIDGRAFVRQEVEV